MAAKDYTVLNIYVPLNLSGMFEHLDALKIKLGLRSRSAVVIQAIEELLAKHKDVQVSSDVSGNSDPSQ